MLALYPKQEQIFQCENKLIFRKELVNNMVHGVYQNLTTFPLLILIPPEILLTDFMWCICFDLYVRRTDFWEAKNGSCQWEKLELRKIKRDGKKVKKKTNYFLC